MMITRQISTTLDGTDLVVDFSYHENIDSIQIESIIAVNPHPLRKLKRIKSRELIRRIRDAVFLIGLDAMQTEGGQES